MWAFSWKWQLVIVFTVCWNGFSWGKYCLLYSELRVNLSLTQRLRSLWLGSVLEVQLQLHREKILDPLLRLFLMDFLVNRWMQWKPSLCSCAVLFSCPSSFVRTGGGVVWHTCVPMAPPRAFPTAFVLSSIHHCLCPENKQCLFLQLLVTFLAKNPKQLRAFDDLNQCWSGFEPDSVMWCLP